MVFMCTGIQNLSLPQTADRFKDEREKTNCG